MGLALTVLKELRQARMEARAGKISLEHYKLDLKNFDQQRDIWSDFIKIEALAIKKGGGNNKIKKTLATLNLISDHEAIDLDVIDTEKEKVKCPGLDDKLIERHECLDFSGAHKFEECEGCETGAITKRLLLSKAIEPVADKQPVI